LSGDAGDELFSGYGRYVRNTQQWNRIARMPYPLRRLAAGSLQTLSPHMWNAVLGPVRALLPGPLRVAPGEKLHQAARKLSARRIDDLYLQAISRWDPARVVIGGQEPLTCMRGAPLALEGLDGIERLMALDALMY